MASSPQAFPQLRRQPGAGLVHPAGETGTPSSMAMTCAARSDGTFPSLLRTTKAAAFSCRPVGRRARVRAWRRVPRSPDRPAARAAQARQRPLGHRPDDLHVGDLRPPRSRSRRTVQGRPASAALRGRLGVLLLCRIQIRSRLLITPRWPPRLRILPALTLGLLPRPPRLFSPRSAPSRKASRSRCCPSTGGARLPPAELHRRSQFERRFQGGRQHGDLLVLRPDHSPQPQPGLPARQPPQAHRTRAASMLNLH